MIDECDGDVPAPEAATTQAGPSNKAQGDENAGCSVAAPHGELAETGEATTAADHELTGPTPGHVEDEATLRRYVEALLFVSPQPLTVAQVARTLRTTFAAVRRAFRSIQDAYADRGIRLVEVGGAMQFRTAPECADVLRRFLGARPVRLSHAAMETLALIAYRQPITKANIDEVRGVDSGSALKMLLDRNLVRVLGRKEEPGRPLLYGTTQAFLEFFNLPSLEDLPSLREYAELTEEGRRQLERDLFARPSDAPPATVDEETRARPVRRWEDLVEVLGEDIGELPAGVEVEPSDVREAYVREDSAPGRQQPQASAEEQNEWNLDLSVGENTPADDAEQARDDDNAK